MRCMLLCMLEALEVPEVMRCMILCMLEAAEVRLYLLEVLNVLGGDGGDAPCATLYAGGRGG